MEYEMPLVLQQVNNPHLFLDTGRLAVYEVSWSSDSQWIVFRSRAANCFSKTLDSPYTDLPATPRPREDFCMKTLSYDDYQASELWLFNVRTAEARAVTSNDVIEYLPLFSPRQPQFIYEQNDDLRLYDVDTQQDKLLFSNGIVSNTNWSPDGQWIAFTVHVSTDASAYTYDLYIIRPDGTGLQCVATDVKDNFHWVP
jgi:Tol biopolymer transport system component